MKAKVTETCAGRTFRAVEGTILTDDVYGLGENEVYMKTTDIQSVINRGSATEIKTRKAAK